MPKLIIWDEAKAKKELTIRLNHASESRRKLEYIWEENERTVYGTKGRGLSPSISLSFTSTAELGMDDVDNSFGSQAINYTFKNLRFIHSQLSANPPTVVPRPTSNDLDDRRKADAADRLIRHFTRQYSLQEMFDRASLFCLLYGTSFVKTTWDACKGDILETDKETGEITLEGDMAIKIPELWNMFVDPEANVWEDVRYVFERVMFSYEEALFKWPDKQDILDKYRQTGTRFSSTTSISATSALEEPKYDVIELFEYWEKGLPTNGYQGRFVICTRDGHCITDVCPNPFKFSPPPKNKAEKKIKVPPTARLPYHIFTDIDIPSRVWGKSFVEFEVPLQDTLNRLDSTMIDNIQAHSAARMILPESAEISESSITNSPWDVIKITGAQPPFFMSPPQLLPDMHAMTDRFQKGIDDLAGVNEAMFGQQSREQSGFSMQYATNQGNMIRRRLFNKYVGLVEGVYKSLLDLVRKHWTEAQTIHVMGKEKAFEAIDIKGADIDGGFDLVVEYGASLSLDPTTRREEMITLMPLFEKAGVDARAVMNMLKLNDLSGEYDDLQLAEDRQHEVFEEMIATGGYIAPRELQDHTNMLTFAYRYVMTTEFKYLDPDKQALIERHIREREQKAAQGPTAAAGGGASQPGSPSPGAPAAAAPGGPNPPGPAPQGPAGTPPAAATPPALQAGGPPGPVGG